MGLVRSDETGDVGRTASAPNNVEHACIGGAVLEFRVRETVTIDYVSARSACWIGLELLHETFVLDEIAMQEAARHVACVGPPKPRPTRHVRPNLSVPTTREIVEESAVAS